MSIHVFYILLEPETIEDLVPAVSMISLRRRPRPPRPQPSPLSTTSAATTSSTTSVWPDSSTTLTTLTTRPSRTGSSTPSELGSRSVLFLDQLTTSYLLRKSFQDLTMLRNPQFRKESFKTHSLGEVAHHTQPAIRYSAPLSSHLVALEEESIIISL